jgi:GGDEF domain-containing protein
VHKEVRLPARGSGRAGSSEKVVGGEPGALTVIELAELVRDGIVLFDAAGAVVRANAAAVTIVASRDPADLGRLADLSAGLVELRPAKWIELRHSTLTWDGQPCRVAIFSDVTAQLALRDAHRTLREIGLVDALTGLSTEPVLRDHLARSLSLAERDHRWVGVLWLQLRRVVRPGPEGQRIADEVLRQIGRRVQLAIRESDLAALFDENTIVVALTAMSAQSDAQVVMVRLLLGLAPPVLVEGLERSVGVVSGTVPASDRAVAVDELLARARAAAVHAHGEGSPVGLHREPEVTAN